MITDHSHHLTKILATCILLIPLLILPVKADIQELQLKYQELEVPLLDNIYGIPIYIESTSEKDSQRGDVYGIIYHPFTKVKAAFSQASNWCDIAPQHLNIKSCTYQHLNGSCKLSFYSGRKFYEETEFTYKLEYLYHANTHQDNYIYTSLGANSGPLGTSKYSIITEAVALTDNSTFIHFSYSYNQSFWTRLAINAYLQTIGWDKIGFTIIDTDQDGKPVYVDGVRGIIERNAVRYYFAIQSFLDTEDTIEEQRFLKRINHWFDLTEKYHQQLYEMDKKDYLKYKQKERMDQIRLQKNVAKQEAVCPPIIEPDLWE